MMQGSATTATSQVTLLLIAPMRRPATIAAKPVTLLVTVPMNPFATSATYQVMWPVSAPSQVWHPRWEVLFVISSAVLVVSSAISVVTAFPLSSASTVVEGATKPMSALLLECLTVAYVGIDRTGICCDYEFTD
jgi:hypothetical protein